MYDPTSKVSLPGYLRDLERRIADRERANPIARASFHDGTRTRGGLGKFAHPGGGEQTGAVFYDAAGDVLLLADDTALTLSKTAITGSAAVAAAASDYVLISDTSDSGELKKALVSSIGGGGGGGGDMLAATYDPQTIADDAFDRANHTGTQTSSTISDFDVEVSNNASVTANTAKVSYTDAAQVATNTGDISTIQGEQTTQDSAIALNTAKVGITTAQANEITANTAKLATVESGADVTDSASVAAAGGLLSANNLSDVADAATARTNLGIVSGGGPILATATIDTSNNLNDGTTARRTITASSLGTDWSIATNALTYSGTPSAVHIEVNVSYTSTGVRAAPVVELWKGTTKLAMAHTGYIRNNSGHNEASSNFTFIDTAPGTNPAYHLESSRGSTRTEAATPLTPSQFAAYVFA